MSKIPNDKDRLNDADIADLFAADKNSAQALEPPVELDALILDNARASHKESSRPPQRETFRQKYTPLIATAAVLLIAIGLTPFNSPEPLSEPGSVTALKPATTLTTDTITQARTLSSDLMSDQVITDSDASDERELSASAGQVSERVAATNAKPNSVQAKVATDSESESPTMLSEDNDAPELATNDAVSTPNAATSNRIIPNALFPSNTTKPNRKTDKTPTDVANKTTEGNKGFELAESTQKDSGNTLNDGLSTRRVRPANYRSSPLLWINEIKQLHFEKNNDSVREELAAFRKAYPENSNEQLLPKELQNLQTE